jgi:hypothetical protein
MPRYRYKDGTRPHPPIRGMANRQGDVDLREAQVSGPQLTAWLGGQVTLPVEGTEHTQTLSSPLPDLIDVRRPGESCT